MEVNIMNNARRKEIIKAIKQIRNLVSNILSDEINSYDNMPDGLKQKLSQFTSGGTNYYFGLCATCDESNIYFSKYRTKALPLP